MSFSAVYGIAHFAESAKQDAEFRVKHRCFRSRRVVHW